MESKQRLGRKLYTETITTVFCAQVMFMQGQALELAQLGTAWSKTHRKYSVNFPRNILITKFPAYRQQSFAGYHLYFTGLRLSREN